MNIIILTYHSIDSSNSIVSIDEETFVKHLQYLKENNFQVVSLSTALGLLKRGKCKGKEVVLTFDDGFENFYTTVYPLLDKFQMPATVFLVTDYCGKDNYWPGQNQSIPKMPLMNWSMVTELAKLGIDFGAHSCSHPDLTKLTFDDAANEILKSRKIIQERTAQQVNYFAYPYGVSNSKIQQIVGKEFQAGLGTFLSPTKIDDGIANLPRVDAYYLKDYFCLLGTPMLLPYLKIRSIARRTRQIFGS